MDREVSTVIEISVALIAISIVIGIISFTVFMGQDMSNDVAVESSKIVSAMEVGELEEMCHQNNVMPTAGAYSIYKTHKNVIPNYYCHICKSDKFCLLNHMDGKVSVQITKSEKGWYIMDIHKVDCNWFDNLKSNHANRKDNGNCVK